MPDWLAPIAYIPAYWGMLLLVGGAAALVFYVVWRSLNGDTRTWAVLPHFPLQVSHHNTWPFMLAMIGIGLVTLLPTVFFEAWAMEGARQAVWNVFLVPAALVALSFFWWPLAWTPTWFKNWALRSKIDPETMRGLLHVVGGDEDAGAVVCGAAEVSPEAGAGEGVHAGGRFIEHEQFGMVTGRGEVGEDALGAQRQGADGGSSPKPAANARACSVTGMPWTEAAKSRFSIAERDG